MCRPSFKGAEVVSCADIRPGDMFSLNDELDSLSGICISVKNCLTPLNWSPPNIEFFILTRQGVETAYFYNDYKVFKLNRKKSYDE